MSCGKMAATTASEIALIAQRSTQFHNAVLLPVVYQKALRAWGENGFGRWALGGGNGSPHPRPFSRREKGAWAGGSCRSPKRLVQVVKSADLAPLSLRERG